MREGMSEKIGYEVQEETKVEPKVILTITVTDDGNYKVDGEGRDPGIFQALGMQLIKTAARLEIKAAL